MIEKLVEQLNDSAMEKRLSALRQIVAKMKAGEIPTPQTGKDVNNHIHTTYSFSPYSPTKAVYMSYMAGLLTTGIMDHDSISGAQEFIEAGKIVGMATTIGWEMRVNMKGTPFETIRINNPDQVGNFYVTVHGVPHDKIPAVEAFLKPICISRGVRNRKIVQTINALLAAYPALQLDYERDICPHSMVQVGGSVTERHVLFGLAIKLIDAFGQGEKLVKFLERDLGLSIGAKIRAWLLETDNTCYAYDLLGLLKAELVEKIYVPADDEECVGVQTLVTFAQSIGAISCAPYLGDVGDSVTGDKKTQAFEDAYLDDLFAFYAKVGFAGCAYMPSRNTLAQLDRVQALCRKYDLIQISGEDINQPRQPFVCMAARAAQFDCLFDTTWALIGHELAATRDFQDRIVGEKAKMTFPTLQARIAAYKQMGLDLSKA